LFTIRSSSRSWTDLPERLTANWSRGKTVYLWIYVVYTTFAILVSVWTPYGDEDRPWIGIVSLLYLVFNVVSVFILGPGLFRRIRQPARLPGFPAHGGFSARLTYRVWRMLMFLLRNVGSIFLLLVAAIAINALATLLFPHLGDLVNSEQPTYRPFISALLALLASCEEVWRVSLLVASLLLLRRLMGQRWQSESTRRTAFGLALAASSLIFGAGHINNFSGMQTVVWMTMSLIGCLLTLFIFTTRNLFLGMFTHGLYDFLSMTGWIEEAVAPILVGFIVTLFLTGWAYRLRRRLLRRSLFESGV
jgi:membrane protease YdiL (CAAX protease family)